MVPTKDVTQGMLASPLPFVKTNVVLLNEQEDRTNRDRALLRNPEQREILRSIAEDTDKQTKE